MSTDLQTLNERGKALAQYLGGDAMKKRLTGALPRHMTPDRMIRIALTAATRNPKLLQCGVESIGLALLQASQLGLEPNGRDAHLVPFRNNKANRMDCVLIPDYKGLIQLAYRSGQVDNVSAKAVYSGDFFEYEFGTNERLKHIPSEEENPGELRYAWAMVRFKNGGSKFIVLNKRDVMRRKKVSKSTGQDSPWNTSPETMWAKSAVKELSKWMPQTSELDTFHKAVAQDDAVEFAGVIDVESVSVERPTAASALARKMVLKPAEIEQEGTSPPAGNDEPLKSEAGQQDFDQVYGNFLDAIENGNSIIGLGKLKAQVVRSGLTEEQKMSLYGKIEVRIVQVRGVRGEASNVG